MPLSVISTPIGQVDDISLRALNRLKECDVLVCEERKVASKLLRALELKVPIYEELNEHSKAEDVEQIFKQYKSKNIALISDCGTPSFCDPGFQLVKLFREQNLEVEIVPGASSLMAFLAGTGLRHQEFYMRGFLPANTEEREKSLKELKKHQGVIILMDTPYRLHKTLQNIADHFGSRQCILGHSLTQENEEFLYGTASEILNKLKVKKAEFLLLIQN